MLKQWIPDIPINYPSENREVAQQPAKAACELDSSSLQCVALSVMRSWPKNVGNKCPEKRADEHVGMAQYKPTRSHQKKGRRANTVKSSSYL